MISQFDNPSGSADRILALYVGTDGRVNIITYINGYSNVTSNNAITTSTWHHVAVTKSGTTGRVYINGVFENSGTVANVGTTTATRVGARENLSPAYPLNGKIDEARMYNRALSPSEVTQLYNFAPGPVAYWNFDEGTGTSAQDTSGNANTGTLTGGPKWTAGKIGKGLSFDGSATYVNIGTGLNSSLVDSKAFSFMAWIKTSASANQQIIGNADWTNPYTGVEFLVESDGEVRLDINQDATRLTRVRTSNTVNNGTWHHMSAIYTGSGTASGMSIFIDGIKVSTTTDYDNTDADATSATNLQVGGRDGASGEMFNGQIDDVRIYNYARTQKQIVSDMNAGHPSVGSPVGSAVGYWKFDEGYGTAANDTTPNDNDLTLSTASWTNSGKFGKAWNGTNALWLSRADDADFDVTATDDYAISLWFKSDSATNPSAVEYLINKANATTAGYAVYANTDGTICFGIDDDATWNPDIASCTTADFYDAAWHHIIGLRDTVQDKTYIYIDGVLRDSDTDSTTATLANSLLLYVGDRDGTDNGDEFTGDIDELKIYRYALTADEVKTEYNRGSSLVLGALGTDPSNPLTPLNSSNALYCPPGNTEGNCASGQAPAPVAEWNFEEGSGTSANDISGNANTGTLTGGPSWTTGKYGKAVSFDGSNDFVSVADSNNLDITSSLAIDAWIYWQGTGTLNGIIAYKEGTSTTAPYGLLVQYSTSKIIFGLNQGAGWHDHVSNSTISQNVWTHVAGVYDTSASQVKLYINGTLDATFSSETGSLPVNANVLSIGREVGQVAEYFKGYIDDVRIYNYARTAAQIAWDYNRGGPVAHFKFDECQGTTVNSSKSPLDSSSSPLTGTITIGATGGNTSAGTCSGSAGEAWKDGATGKFNSSLDFDGTDDYTQVTDTANLRFDESTKDFSLFAWVKRTTTGTEYIISKEDADDDGWRLMFNSSNQVVCSEDATDVTSTSAITDTNWHLLGCTIDRDGNGQTYVDGRADGAAVSMGTDAMATTSNIRLATRSYTSANYLNGQIDDVKIFNYALTATQVKTEYNQAAAVRFGPSTGSP